MAELILHYLMNDNETNTTILDDEGNYNGVSQRNTSLLTAIGKINQAIDFNSSLTDYILIDSNFILNMDAAWSIGFWFYLDLYPSFYPTICTLKTSGSNGFHIFLGGDSAGASYRPFAFGNNEFVKRKVSGGGDYVAGWHHAVIIFDGIDATDVTKYHCYIDNEEKVLDAPGGFANFANTSIIGNTPSGTFFKFDGRIDDFRIYDFALDVSQVDFLYNSGNGTEASDFSGTLKVRKNLEFLYNIYDVINNDIEFIYNIGTQVHKDLQYLYNLAFITIDLNFPYDISAPISKDLEFLYHRGDLITKDLEFLYDTVQFVSKDLTFPYNIGQTISNDLQFIYSLQALVYKDLEFLYHRGNLITKDLIFPYSSQAFVRKDLQFIYNNLLSIGRNVRFPYHNFATVNKDLQIVYNILQTVGQNNQFLYNLLSVIQKDLQFQYAIISNPNFIINIRKPLSQQININKELLQEINLDKILINKIDLLTSTTQELNINKDLIVRINLMRKN